MNPFIAICVQWKASAGSWKILTGVCLFCESVAAASCQKNTSLHSDSGRNTVAIQRRLRTYGAHSLDRYFIYSSSPNFPRWLFIQIQDQDRGSWWKQTVHNSLSLRIKLLVVIFFPLIVIPLKSALIYCVLNYALLVIARRKMANCFKACLRSSLAQLLAKTQEQSASYKITIRTFTPSLTSREDVNMTRDNKSTD